MASLARATAVMSIGTVLSRVTGLVRLMAIAAALGTAETRLADTYNLANTAPNIIYELVLGGILTSVFVPVFVELLEKEGREKAWEIASAILNLCLVAVTAITIIGIVLAPYIARLYSYRLEGDQAALQQDALTFLLRLFIPQIIFYALAAATAGLLNAHRRFGPQMYTPVLNNLAVTAVFIAFYKINGIVSLKSASTSQLLLIGLGTTGGVALMALAQLPFLRGLGRYRFTFSASHPSVKKLARLSIYVVGYVVANQIGYLIVQWLANGERGAYSAYVNAFTFFMLPHGLFAVSVITALLPEMSRQAVHARWDEFRERLSIGVRATLFLVIPATVGYLILGEPIIRLLLERGVMTPRSTELVAGVLAFFVLGLVPFSTFQLFLRAFYAMHDTKTPFLINCGAVVLNVAINIPMFAWLGAKGLAAGHAISYVFGVSLQARYLSRRIGGIDGRRIARSALRIFASALCMGAAVWATSLLFDAPPGSSFAKTFLGVVGPMAVGAVAYIGSAQLLGVEELAFVKGLLRGRKPEPTAPTDR